MTTAHPWRNEPDINANLTVTPHLTLKMTAAEAVETSVTTINSFSQDFTNLDDQSFHTVIETRVEVWENEKLKWEDEPAGRVFPRYFEFSQTSTSVSITYGNTEKTVFYFFYKITRRKLVTASNATKPNFSQKNNAYSSFFLK